MTSTGPLADRVVVITGSAAGVGRAAAIAAAGGGARVACCASPGEPLDEVAARAERIAGRERILSLVADVSDERDVEALFDRVLDEFGRVDALINAAHAGSARPLSEISVREFDEVLAANLTGAFLVCVRAVQEFLAQGGGGRIVIVASRAGRDVLSCPLLATSRGALHGLTRTIAKEYGSRGVHANLLLADDGGAEAAEQMAGPVLFLASDRASFVNGATLRASGRGRALLAEP